MYRLYVARHSCTLMTSRNLYLQVLFPGRRPVWRRLFSLCYTLHVRWYPRIERDLFDRHDMQLTVVIRVRVFKRSAIFHSVCNVCTHMYVCYFTVPSYMVNQWALRMQCAIVGQGNHSFTSVITIFFFCFSHDKSVYFTEPTPHSNGIIFCTVTVCVQ